MLENKNPEEFTKAEFNETRQAIKEGFSTITTYAISANNILVQKDKESLKSQIKSWRNNLNERKKSYWSCLRTENISSKYEEWYANEPAIMPKKYTPKTIQGEPEEQKQIRMRHAMQTMKCDIDIMKARMTNFKSRYEAVDQTMMSEIETASNDESTKMALIELWFKECKEEEAKSKAIWKEKEEWLLKLEMEQTPDQQQNQDQPTNQQNARSTRLRSTNQPPHNDRYNNFRQQQQIRPNRKIDADFWQDNRTFNNRQGRETDQSRTTGQTAGNLNGSFLPRGRGRTGTF